jgi:hypothetical protein
MTIHCGSLNALDHRVPGLLSYAADAGVPAFSVDEAVTTRFGGVNVLQPPAAAEPYTWNSQRL